LTSNFDGQLNVHVVHIVLSITGAWLQKLEQSRWSLHLATLELEKERERVCYTDTLRPLLPDELSVLRANSVNIQGYIRSVARHSRLLGEIITSIERAVDDFATVSSCAD
jgi:hypothetical protein